MEHVTSKSSKHQIVVIGGNGKTGARVVKKLKALDWPVSSASRSSEVKFDWHDRSTWEPALKEADAVYITYQPDIAIPGAVGDVALLGQIASKTGVKKVVLLSGRGEPEAQEAEKVIMQSGLDWTIVRASWFAQNFSEGFLIDPLKAGFMALPAGEVGEPFIDVDDIADVVVAALTENRHSGKVYEVTGPRLLTFREAVAEIANASGRSIQYQQVSADDYTAELKRHQVPAEITSFIGYLFTEVLDGRNEKVMHGVEEAIGRKATDFSEYVKKAVAQGAWN